MNAPRMVGGTAVLVLAAFWAIVILDSIQGVGLILVIAAPFVILLAAGAYGIISGLGSPSMQPSGSSPRAGRRLGPLGMTILQMIAQGKSQQEMATATAVSAFVIGEKVEALTKAGFLYENSLSEKGFEVLKALA